MDRIDDAREVRGRQHRYREHSKADEGRLPAVSGALSRSYVYNDPADV
jgi:hypothetical protein